jgi:endonuclease YncB( thermonuclease family)
MAVAILVSAVSLQAQHRSPPVLVHRVIDGDSIEVATIGRVNLLGIAAPRPASRSGSSHSLAQEAQQRLSGLLANRWIRLEYEHESGRSGRSAYVFLEDGRCVNEWMLREGLARTVSKSGLRRSRELLAAEAEARLARRGIWVDLRPP